MSTSGAAEAPDGPSRPSSNELTTMLVHLYRAESSKADGWRRRLDTTTNWAVVTMAAASSFALGDEDPQRHIVILMNALLATFFLLIEARRYRFYDIWQTRVRLLESDFFAPLLHPEGPRCHPDWQRLLSMELRHPTFHVSLPEAVGWRLRRNYGWIFAILLLTWLIKLTIHPETSTSLGEFVRRAAFGPAPGWLIVAAVAIFAGTLLALAVGTRRLHDASGEIMPLRETHEKIETTAAQAAVTEVRDARADSSPEPAAPARNGR